MRVRPHTTWGRRRVGALIASAFLAIMAGCRDGGTAPDAAATTTVPTTNAAAPLTARDALLAPGDLPVAMEVRDPAEHGDLEDACPELASDVEDLTGVPGVDAADTAARALDVGLPAVRHDVARFADEAAAREMFDLRASGEFALCLAAVGAETLERDGAVLAGRGFREADPGDLGDEAASWVLSFTLEEAGVSLQGNFEVTTLRVGPIVSTVLLTTSPLFPLTSVQRTEVLTAAVSRATTVAEASG